MQMQPQAEFGIADARRILGEVFAPWVQDLNLAVERIEHAQRLPIKNLRRASTFVD